ncbi:DsrE family protein [Tropicimonas sp. TH_r6]|uniref:DsrE family protein n=1 Tax=Tropicimonas sp. TH_r6 TaxID=3082085 RepID=UPI0029531CB7|nr:DsrE family protein [Tropicimonas sp. TH_r6]MDV7143602.1 DsrE family protein [Tropicimonas sp. TH_r6]
MRFVTETLRNALVGAALLAAGSLPSHAEDAAPSFFFTLTSGEVNEAGAALHLARTFRGKGRSVHVLVIGEALKFATRGVETAPFAGYGKTPQEMLGMVIEDGVTVSICQMCLSVQSVEEGQLIDGVAIVNGYDVLDAIEQSEKQLSF